MLQRFFIAMTLLTAGEALAWGFDGHRRLAKLMHEPLPNNSCLKQWIQSQQSSAFQDDACDPDRWRQEGTSNYDANEWPRHFLEIDYAFPVNTYPRDWEAVKARFGNFAEKNGQVPWHVETMYGQLVEAFRSQNATAIRNTLAHFSHYVTDSFSVLHNTKNFDPNGLHQRWETDMLDASSRIDTITARAEIYFGTLGRADARNHIFDIVEVGNGLLPELVNADLANPNDMRAFFNDVLDLTARRWGDALTLQASLIASAWVDAGSPRLSGMSNTCSMDVPQGTLVLKGYALPPVRVEEDGGTVVEEGGDSTPPSQEPQPVGCTCQSQPANLALWATLAWALARRRG